MDSTADIISIPDSAPDGSGSLFRFRRSRGKQRRRCIDGTEFRPASGNPKPRSSQHQ